MRNLWILLAIIVASCSPYRIAKLTTDTQTITKILPEVELGILPSIQIDGVRTESVNRNLILLTEKFREDTDFSWEELDKTDLEIIETLFVDSQVEVVVYSKFPVDSINVTLPEKEVEVTAPVNNVVLETKDPWYSGIVKILAVVGLIFILLTIRKYAFKFL